MMLFKLSIKNIQKSIKDYAIYFFTLILGICIFYVFNAIETQTVLLDVSKYTYEIIDLLNNTLAGVSVFVSFILGGLILYASRFLMKRRNKEFGIYLVLGMGKRKISFILLVENLLIGLISLIVGIAAGVCISQLMSAFVANMFEADMTKYQFVFSKDACIKTVSYFAIIYLIVILFQTTIIGKCKLIDLLQAEKRTEKMKLKNSWLCTVLCLISMLLLIFAYYQVTIKPQEMNNSSVFLFIIGLGVFATYLFVWSLSGLLLKIAGSVKSFYLKDLNCFVLRQVSSKMNTMVIAMGTICLMLFVTICVLSSALSIKNSMTKNLEELAPADLLLRKEMNLGEEMLSKGYNQSQIESSKMQILEVLQEIDFDIEKYLSEYIMFYMYYTPEATWGSLMGDKREEIEEQFPYLHYDIVEDIMKLSDYNKIAGLYGNETYSLAEDEYLIVADFSSMVSIRNQVLESQQAITIFGHTLKPKYKECQEGFVEISSNHINTGIVIVPDSVVEEDKISRQYLIGNYITKNKEEIEKIEAELTDLDSYAEEYLLPEGATKMLLVEGSMGLGAMMTFIGLYLGMIFLIASAAILALKELSESADNFGRYQILRKLGADEGMLNRALFWQMGIFFFIPLLIAVIHSVFGIHFCSYLLETFGNEQLLPAILVTASILILIYGGYFVLTYVCSKNMIRE